MVQTVDRSRSKTKLWVTPTGMPYLKIQTNLPLREKAEHGILKSASS